MIELWLNNNKVDVDDNIDISITYKSTDLSNPTAVKSSFSKSVVLKGTKTNNEIFGNIYKLDRSLLDNGTLYGVSYDAKKRVDFVLYENSDILEKGYFSLDSIKVKNGVVEYSITLYGQLGDFFYNLSTNDDGETKTLADLYYGFSNGDAADPKDDTIMTKEEESKNTILSWNAKTINLGWTALKGRDSRTVVGETEFDPTIMRPENWIVAAPTYNGLNDDFDNDVVLVNMGDSDIAFQGNLSRDAITKNGARIYPYVDFDGDPLYADTNGWIKVTAPRELVEWEIGDLRSSQQRPAIKSELIFRAISNPENNGGYEVIWDKAITDSPYYKDTYIIRDRLDFDESDNKTNSVYFVTNQCKVTRSETESKNNNVMFTVGGAESYTVDTTSLNEPLLQLTIQDKIELVPLLDNTFQYAKFTFSYPIWISNEEQNVNGCIAYRLRAFGDDGAISYSPYYFVGEAMDDKDAAASIASYNNITDYVPIKRLAKMYDYWRAGWFHWVDYDTEEEAPIRVQLKLPKGKNVRVYLEKYFLRNDMGNRSELGLKAVKSKTVMPTITYNDPKDLGGKFYATSLMVGNTSDEQDAGYESGLYDGSTTTNIQKTRVTKKTLFGSTDTPFDYLVSFTKMFDFRYRMDSALKRVYIEPRNKYYIDKVYDLSNAIDYSKEYTIIPTTVDHKWYQYGLETPESYGQYLYGKKNKVEYGNYKYDTGYNFNSDINNIFEDNIYKNTVPYKLTSIFFNRALGSDGKELCPATFASSYTMTYPENGISNLSSTTERGKNKLKKEVDSNPRLCMFDAEDANLSDIDNAFVFFDGVRSCRVLLSDNLPIMGQINGGNCYIFSPIYTNGATYGYADIDSSSTEIIGYTHTTIPYFSKYKTNKGYTYEYSLDFKKPNDTFIDDSANYGSSIDIFSRFWAKYLDDVFDKDSKTVELSCFLPEKPNEAMRKFYYFGGSYWSLNEIKDYNPTKNEAVRCVFVKVRDKNNYLS